MGPGRSLFLVVVWPYLLTFPASGIRLPACRSGGVEVSETASDVIITCDQFSAQDTVTWYLSDEVGNAGTTSLGSCSPSTCNPASPTLYGVSRPSSTVSQLTIKSPLRGLADYSVRCSTGVSTTVSCRLNTVYPAEVSNCRVQVQETSSTWTVSGSCDVTKVFSSSGSYTCQWFRGDSQSQTVSVATTTYSTSAHADTRYRTGRCTFSSTDVSTTDKYYKAVVYPGATSTVYGPLNVDTPSVPTISCTPDQWVPANTHLTCTCNTDDIGQPQGRLQWIRDGSVLSSGGKGVTTLTMPPQNLTQSDHGNSRAQVTCRVDWIEDRSATHTAKVAWGPSDVSIPQDRTFTTDITGSRELDLTCNPQTLNPGAVLMTYSWTGRCQDNTDRTCTIQPRPPGDDGLVTTCTVTNTYNNDHRQQDTYSLTLHYPPLVAPVIRGYKQPLYAGDDLTLTCKVSGGQPLVTSVTFACPPRHPDNASDVKGPSSVSSSLSLSLTESDDGIVCSCNAVWKEADYYTLTNSTTINVYYPPSQPTISATTGYQYPFIAGDGGKLTCSSTKAGNPPAHYQWDKTAGGQTATEGDAATLTFDTLTPEHNGREVTCRVRNTFTEDKNQPVNIGTFIMEVYYSPTISVASLDVATKCEMNSGVPQCLVSEGGTLHMNCSADSNPSPAQFLWRLNGLDLDRQPTLRIPSADRTRETGQYRCVVTSGTLTGGRDPLMSTYNVSVFVTYQTVETHLTLNSEPHNLTVNETDTVVMTCRADGRPTPTMDLINTDSREIQATSDGGQLVLTNQESWLNHTLSATCQHTGTYRCTAGNTGADGTSATANTMLFVNCKPRNDSMDSLPDVNFKDTAIQLTFEVVAYPTPRDNPVYYVGNTSSNDVSEERDVKGLVDVHCLPTTSVYISTCHVIVDNITVYDAGFYKIRIGNDFGYSDFSLTVLFNETNRRVGPQDANDVPYGAVGGGIAAVILAAAIVGAVIFLRKRRLRKPSGTANGSARKHASLHVTGNGTTTGDTCGGASVQTDYEHLNMGDVGTRSPYSTFQPQHQADRSPDHVYENTIDDSTGTYVNTGNWN